MRDSQRNKLYRWERSLGTTKSPAGINLRRSALHTALNDSLAPVDIEQLIDRALTLYGCSRPVTVKYVGNKRQSTAFALAGEIKLASWGLTPAVVLHETAHII